MADKADDDKKGDEEKGGKKKLILIAAPVLLVVVLAAVYFLVLKPSSAEDPAAAGATAAHAAQPSPAASYVEGPVVKLDPITINLANGKFLKLGISLQATADAGEEVSGAKALDAAIELFSQKTVEELATREGREKAKLKLEKRLLELYEQKVYEVYFTEFVMQ
jgi:flagellar FliL protein